MALPLSFSLRNLWARKLTTLLTAGGMSLVVFVFTTVLMLEEGLRATLVATGAYDNVLLIRRGSSTEIQSGIDRSQAGIIESQPEIALGEGGEAMVAKEVVVLISLPKKGSSAPSNVVIRGAGEKGPVLRPQVHLTEGRIYRPGSSEIIVGRGIANGFEGVEVGNQLRFGTRDWTIVGIFDAGKSGFDSEIWGDGDQMMQAFRRTMFSSIVMRLNDPSAFEQLQQRLADDQRLTVEVKREAVFYSEQSEALAYFIRILGLTLSIIFSLGAIIGAMITMFASVANRTAEIGTLRALGFQRPSVLGAFLFESLLLGALGAAIGIALSSMMQWVSFSTLNWTSFAELVFSFNMTPKIVLWGMIFGMSMGLVGGVLPAARASRLKIVDALRAA